MAGTRWLNEREQRAWRALQLMQLRLTGELSRQLGAESRLSWPDYQVLVVVTNEPEGRMRLFELGTTLGWEQSRLSHHIGRMAERGLVKKESCATDRRGFIVSATARGRRELASAAPGHVAAVRRLFIDQLNSQQLDVIAEIGETVLAAIDAASPRED